MLLNWDIERGCGPEQRLRLPIRPAVESVSSMLVENYWPASVVASIRASQVTSFRHTISGWIQANLYISKWSGHAAVTSGLQLACEPGGLLFAARYLVGFEGKLVRFRSCPLVLRKQTTCRWRLSHVAEV